MSDHDRSLNPAARGLDLMKCIQSSRLRKHCKGQHRRNRSERHLRTKVATLALT
jgi:hypothetical protein